MHTYIHVEGTDDTASAAVSCAGGRTERPAPCGRRGSVPRGARVPPCAPDVALVTAVRVCRHLSQSHDGPTGGAAGSMESRVVDTEATEACARDAVYRALATGCR